MRARGRRRQSAATTYKLCSLLLSYPDEELLAARDEVVAVVAELRESPAAAALREFCGWWTSTPPLAAAQHYVETFDLRKRSGLYLTFYGDGDRRERGAALLRLKRMYRSAGLPLEGTELPDFLPAMLEFAADAPDGRGEIVLREHRAALELLHAALADLDSPYARVLDAVRLTLGEPSAADRARAVVLGAGGPPQELVGIEPFAPPEVVPAMEARR
ncbi:MAG TPA: nitrate reductase molybdenum cofactor assembly chaperone [Solirubrobacteraceae bacterium]|jgi:nitrate reductase delta subunit|nr:nitrate reductase molybdenum cofactor assembly chaperone [Solirubrobacteraceae bacterium]